MLDSTSWAIWPYESPDLKVRQSYGRRSLSRVMNAVLLGVARYSYVILGTYDTAFLDVC